MDSGVAALLGAFVGALSSLGGTVLNGYLTDRREKKRNEPARRLLLQMLKTEYEWRDLSKLANVIGKGADETKGLLLEIGARGSETGKDWALIDRCPLPSNPPPSN